ncbi:uncharacterized protein LOC111383539 isoform X2 [Olea europaea var. sylvestris]|uniref:uncharacterized protein LOC111383539 isoform X2 n=1 Tax=Olea europaea var. sylvestris TaxID=158386 RepID=UPI000C1D4FB1|nr:uncharacterized protein LOC111383539 isoform X2 [Olea europaea var. sylvestris]
MVPPASLFFSSIDTISGSQIPIYQIMITSVSNYTSMSSLVPIGCHCYGGTQVMKNSSSFLSPLKCPMPLFLIDHRVGRVKSAVLRNKMACLIFKRGYNMLFTRRNVFCWE